MGPPIMNDREIMAVVGLLANFHSFFLFALSGLRHWAYDAYQLVHYENPSLLFLKLMLCCKTIAHIFNVQFLHL